MLQMLFSSRPNCNTSCHVHNIKEPLELHAKCSHYKGIRFTWWIKDKADAIGKNLPFLKMESMPFSPGVNTTIIVEGKLLRCLKITNTDVLTVNTVAGCSFVGPILDHIEKYDPPWDACARGRYFAG